LESQWDKDELKGAVSAAEFVLIKQRYLNQILTDLSGTRGGQRVMSPLAEKDVKVIKKLVFSHLDRMLASGARTKRCRRVEMPRNSATETLKRSGCLILRRPNRAIARRRRRRRRD